MLYLFASHMVNKPYLFQNEMSAVKTLVFSVRAARELILLCSGIWSVPCPQ